MSKKAPITNGPPKRAKKSAKTAKRILDGVLVSPELYTALIKCYGELTSIHMQFGDFDNAKAYSNALASVSENATSDFVNDLRHQDINIVGLAADVVAHSGFKFNKATFAEMITTLANTNQKFYMFSVLTKEEITARIAKLYVDHLGLDSDTKLGLEDTLNISKYGGDSLDSAELVMALEEEFNIEIPDDVVDYITYATFNDLAEGLKYVATLDNG